MNSYKLEAIAFLSGALVMILELVGSRILSPYFGSSIYIWTGMIGVILGFLSLGYYYGGVLADKGITSNRLAEILWYAGTFIFLIAIFKEPMLEKIAMYFVGETKKGSLFSIILLFGPASALLGCVTPFLIKLRLDNFDNLGKDVGRIYALSTMGSITGTFLAGYSLIPYFGNTTLTILVAVVLFLMSVWIDPKLSLQKVIFIFVLLFLYYSSQVLGMFKLNVLADIDTGYNRVLIREIQVSGRKLRTLTTDKMGIQSAIYEGDKSELFSSYVKGFRDITTILPKSKESLMIGGAGFAFPRHFISEGLGQKMDVVEIDPGMEKISKDYLFFQDILGLDIIVDDARNFVKNPPKKYDLVFLDAFNSIMPPPHLTTDTFFKNISNTMTEEGVLVVNLISSITSKNSQFLVWEYSTLKNVFKHVDVYRAVKDRPSHATQNLLLIAHKSDTTKNILESSNTSFAEQKVDTKDLLDSTKILTDDYAPVEHLTRTFVANF